MTVLTWDEMEHREYTTGVSKGVLFPFDTQTNTYGTGVAWNGIKTITESPSGSESTAVYADNIKYLSLLSPEELKITIEAYAYPPEFEACDGTKELIAGVKLHQQTRVPFGLAYVTRLGNAKAGDTADEILHIVYNCTAAPSEKAFATVSDSPEALAFSWECTSNGETLPGYSPVYSVSLQKSKLGDKYAKFLDKLHGSANANPTIILPGELATIAK